MGNVQSWEDVLSALSFCQHRRAKQRECRDAEAQCSPAEVRAYTCCLALRTTRTLS